MIDQPPTCSVSVSGKLVVSVHL